DGETTGTLTLGSNGEDVYLDATNLTATITAVSGGNFEQINGVGNSATAYINDTVTPVTVTLSGSTVDEGPSAAYTFTATLSEQSHGVTTITTDQGVIHIADGETTGTLTLGSNGEDVYLDATNLTA